MPSGRAVSRQTEYQLKQERNRLGRFLKTVETRPYQILLEESARILAEMRLQVPVESGDLRDSLTCTVEGKALTPTLVATASSVHRGYDYAEVQHDTAWFNHPNGGKWRFVADPFESGVARIKRRFEEEITIDK